MKARVLAAVGIIILVILIAAGLMYQRSAEKAREAEEESRRAKLERPSKLPEAIKPPEAVPPEAPEEALAPVTEEVVEVEAPAPVEPVPDLPMPPPMESVECSADSSKLVKSKTAAAPADMIYVPGGEFVMGSPPGVGHPDENPARRVCVGGYYIDRYEVTNARFKEFVEATGYVTEAESDPDAASGRTWRTPYGPESSADDAPDNPVACVSWNDANAYAKWAGKRLPTEAEWEKAARGTDGRLYPWGNEFSPGAVNMNIADVNSTQLWRNTSVDDGFKTAAPVGSFPGGRSAYGVEDMAGNVWEWCLDWWDNEYYMSGSAKDPAGPETGEAKVIRGGSWFYDAFGARATHRSYLRPEGNGSATGFRCVKDVTS